jgi:hypothetical protein
MCDYRQNSMYISKAEQHKGPLQKLRWSGKPSANSIPHARYKSQRLGGTANRDESSNQMFDQHACSLSVADMIYLDA